MYDAASTIGAHLFEGNMTLVSYIKIIGLVALAVAWLFARATVLLSFEVDECHK